MNQKTFNNLPLVSIITPSYNQGQFIEKTILSVINQSYNNIQYIIIDGGSTDSTMEIVEKYKNKIDIIVHEKDDGQADAINKGFKLAKGELVGWINSDDILYPDCIEKIVNFYLKYSKSLSVIIPTKVDWIDIKGQVIKIYEIKGRSRNDLINFNYDIVQQGSFYKKDDVISVGYCNSKLNYCMDLELVLKLSNYGELGFIDDSLAGFRMYETTKTMTGGNKFLKEIDKVLKTNNMRMLSRNYFRIRKIMFKNLVKNALGIY